MHLSLEKDQEEEEGEEEEKQTEQLNTQVANKVHFQIILF